MSEKRGWYGVDLDGTLAEYHGWVGPDHIGPPIAAMVDRIKAWLGQGYGVRIVTARAFNADQATIVRVQDWTEQHIGHRLPVTCQKDYGMIQLWDDRAVQVIENTGVPVSRADLPPTISAAMQLPEVRALVEALENIGHMGFDMPATLDLTDDAWRRRRTSLMQQSARAALAAIKEPKL